MASLHQAIAERLPMRLAFYESFLNPEGLRDGKIGLAPLTAVISFLRLEGVHYAPIVAAAGTYAAEWTVASMSPLRRRMIAAMPEWLRRRLVLRLAGELVRSSCDQSHATWQVRKGQGQVQLHASIFCTVREPVHSPLCGFYAAAGQQLLRTFRLPLRLDTGTCRATSRAEVPCVLTLVTSEETIEPMSMESVA